MTLRLVPPNQAPNDEYPLVKHACDERPSRCAACSMRLCPYDIPLDRRAELAQPTEGELP